MMNKRKLKLSPNWFVFFSIALAVAIVASLTLQTAVEQHYQLQAVEQATIAHKVAMYQNRELAQAGGWGWLFGSLAAVIIGLGSLKLFFDNFPRLWRTVKHQPRTSPGRLPSVPLLGSSAHVPLLPAPYSAPADNPALNQFDTEAGEVNDEISW